MLIGPQKYHVPQNWGKTTDVGKNWPTITAGQTATWSFQNTADSRLGALTWEVWSMLPDATSTSSWSANPSSTTTTLSVTTTAQTPPGDYAIGIHGISPVTCQHSDDNASNVYVTIVSPATPGPVTPAPATQAPATAAPATPMPIAGLCNPPTWPPGTNPGIIFPSTPAPGCSAPIQVTCNPTDPIGNSPGGTFGSILPVPFHSSQRQTQCVPLTARAKIANIIPLVECQTGWGIHGNHCAQALNQILKSAIGHTIPEPGDTCHSIDVHACSTTWVPDIGDMLGGPGSVRPGIGKYGHRIPISQSMPGDIDIEQGNDPIRGENHIGICLKQGCTQVLSNSGSAYRSGPHGAYCAKTKPNMSDTGFDYPANAEPYVYRVDK